MSNRRKVTHSEAVNRYARKAYDRIQILCKKGEKARWERESKNLGFDNVTQFVRWCVEEKIGKPQLNGVQLDCNDAQNDIE